MPETENTLDTSVTLPVLGKRPTREDDRTLQFSRYRVGMPPVMPTPVEASWVTKVSHWDVLGNDTVGDCTTAAAAHMIQQWTHYANSEFDPTTAQTIAAYSAVSGYDPSDPSTDQGATMIDVLNYWRHTGIAGHRIHAYAQVDFHNPDELMEAIYLFGNVYLGIQLPLSVQRSNRWIVPDGGTSTHRGKPGGWGGHCVPVMAMSPETLTCITWGQKLKMSHNFLSDYADECYAVLSLDWVNSRTGMSPGDINWGLLEQDLSILQG